MFKNLRVAKSTVNDEKLMSSLGARAVYLAFLQMVALSITEPAILMNTTRIFEILYHSLAVYYVIRVKNYNTFHVFNTLLFDIVRFKVLKQKLKTK